MDLKPFTYILRVSELQNITKAAESLYISQSSLSHYIKKVENNLGAEIFDRSTNPLTLTDAGKLYIETAKDVLTRLERLEDGIEKINSHQKGTIRVGIPKSRGSFLLPYILPEFMKKYPEINIKLSQKNSNALLSELNENSIDFAIIPPFDLEDDFSSIPIYQEELFFVTSPQLLPIDFDSEKKVINNLAILNDFPMILSNKNHGIRKAADSIFQQFNIQPNIILETSNNETAYRMASTGIGGAIVPNITLQSVNSINKIQAYSITDSGLNWPVSAIIKKNRQLTPPMREFIQMISKTANDFL